VVLIKVAPMDVNNKVTERFCRVPPQKFLDMVCVVVGFEVVVVLEVVDAVVGFEVVVVLEVCSNIEVDVP
jgi:hypothetical protein